MVLNINVQIVGCPIVREPDGLAMSSRNALLTPAHRQAAPLIRQTLLRASQMAGRMSVGQLKEWVCSEIERSPLLRVVYFEIADALSLRPAEDWSGGQKMGFIAVQAADVRLIDNIKL